MPYKNIVFVKLEKRLLNDPRWWTISEGAQLIYVKLILLAAETYNKIPLNEIVLRDALRSRISIDCFKKCLEEVEKSFPKLRKNKHFRYFAEFETKTNYIPKREIPRKSPGLPKDGVDKEEDIDKEKKKSEKIPQLSDDDFLKTLKTNPAYKGVDLENELAKMDAWLLTHPDRKKTRRFIVNWLNKIDKPLAATGGRKPIPNKDCSTCGGTGKILEGEHKGRQCYCNH